MLTTKHEIAIDSAGPGRFRGGLGIEKGGLPSIPHGVWLNQGTEDERFLGSFFSPVPIQPGDVSTRPSAGGGGFGDPLERTAEEVLEDVIDDYVSIEHAAADYGVVIEEVDAELDDYRIPAEQTEALRIQIRANRRGWLDEDAEAVAARYRECKLGMLDVIRRHDVILHWGTGELLENSTTEYRQLMQRRSAAHWDS
ncbi:hypothetical protein [Glutamicibacter arilaitensis]|uniref:hypothetical protein n=1 Tax=Glutamicibacter arilaitensis TaxID=256701 RepID=UPI003F93C0C6